MATDGYVLLPSSGEPSNPGATAATPPAPASTPAEEPLSSGGDTTPLLNDGLTPRELEEGEDVARRRHRDRMRPLRDLLPKCSDDTDEDEGWTVMATIWKEGPVRPVCGLPTRAP